ncbi:MAG: HIT domain-containing protein [Spirochaetia bacterium]|nr:HIT domain-containing protein [Spirochaetia bacterium]
MTESCVLCALALNPEAIAGGMIYKSKNFMVIHHQPPIDIEGWIIIVPLKHAESQSGLSDEELAELYQIEKKITGILEMDFSAERVYRVCFSEQVRHIHFHLIPRTREVPGNRRGPNIFLRDDSSLVSKEKINQFCSKISAIFAGESG